MYIYIYIYPRGPPSEHPCPRALRKLLPSGIGTWFLRELLHGSFGSIRCITIMIVIISSIICIISSSSSNSSTFATWLLRELLPSGALRVCMYVCIYIYIYICLSLSLSIYIYIYMYTHV